MIGEGVYLLSILRRISCVRRVSRSVGGTGCFARVGRVWPCASLLRGGALSPGTVLQTSRVDGVEGF